MKKSLILFIFSLFLWSCQSDDTTATSITPIETTLIGKGNLYGGSSQDMNQQNLVITNETELNDFLNLLDPVNNISGYFNETDINFTEFTLIIAIDEIRPSGGHELGIDVNTDNEIIFVTVTSISPQGQATTVLTQPYHIVKIPKSTLPIIFQ